MANLRSISVYKLRTRLINFVKNIFIKNTKYLPIYTCKGLSMHCYPFIYSIVGKEQEQERG